MVAYWLLAGVMMIVVQVLLGGITRLTGSGLSITEWKPIMGAIPPMTEQEWQEAFSKYQHTGQWKYLNSDFQLGDFKFIFFWEWFHRLWARLLGVVFAIGFIYFLVRGYFKRDMVIPLVILFVLGAAQGLVGWIMVVSGLNDTNLYVNHIKLAMHFIAALVLLCYTLWFALKLLVPAEEVVYNTRFRNFTLVIIALLAVQLVYGAFMAGIKGAMSAPTWPDINGVYLPGTIFSKSWVNDVINIHLIHRTLAYLLFTLLMFWLGASSRVGKDSARMRKARWWPFALVWVQVALGIITVLLAPRIVLGKFGIFETFAELHQLVAMFLLMALIVVLYLVRPAKR